MSQDARSNALVGIGALALSGLYVLWAIAKGGRDGDTERDAADRAIDEVYGVPEEWLDPCKVNHEGARKRG